MNHSENLNGYSLGAKMNPEFRIVKSDNKYFIRSKWIDNDVLTKEDEKGYLLDKIQ